MAEAEIGVIRLQCAEQMDDIGVAGIRLEGIAETKGDAERLQRFRRLPHLGHVAGENPA